MRRQKFFPWSNPRTFQNQLVNRKTVAQRKLLFQHTHFHVAIPLKMKFFFSSLEIQSNFLSHPVKINFPPFFSVSDRRMRIHSSRPRATKKSQLISTNGPRADLEWEKEEKNGRQTSAKIKNYSSHYLINLMKSFQFSSLPFLCLSSSAT